MLEGLTSMQRRILEVIRDFSLERGRPPYMEEIRETVGLGSRLDVYNQLMVLKGRGLIRRDESDPLAIQVTKEAVAISKPDAEMACVPLVGTVAAGTPILAEEHIEEEFHLPRTLVGQGDLLFMLQVRGDSMSRAGVLDGDYVVVKQQETAEPGDMVAARIGDEATIKTFFYKNGEVQLLPQSDNPRHQPIDGENAEIVGKVVMVIRQVRGTTRSR